VCVCVSEENPAKEKVTNGDGRERERERKREGERDKDELAANEVSGCQLQWRPHLLAHNYPSFKDQLS
jgi:hypothetical protein